VVRAVIFDCYGVLVGEQYMMVRKQYPEMRAGFDEIFEAGDLGQETFEERTGRIEELLDGRGLDGKEVLETEGNMGMLNRELLGSIKKLRGRYKTGVLSNTCDGFYRSFEGMDLGEYFDDVVLSCEVGLLKPDPRIFELAAERLGVLPEECAFVDDSEGNVRAAEDCGMKGILYEWGMDVQAFLEK